MSVRCDEYNFPKGKILIEWCTPLHVDDVWYPFRVCHDEWNAATQCNTLNKESRGTRRYRVTSVEVEDYA